VGKKATTTAKKQQQKNNNNNNNNNNAIFCLRGTQSASTWETPLPRSKDAITIYKKTHIDSSPFLLQRGFRHFCFFRSFFFIFFWKGVRS